jgi:Outer membrane protein/protective antigen OMA87
VGGALSSGAIALQLRGEDSHANAAIAAVDSSEHRAFGSAAALLWWDSMNAPDFATHGVGIRARYERAFWGGTAFTRTLASTAFTVPLGARLALTGRAAAGGSTQDRALPLDYRFYLGGLVPSAVLREAQMPFAGLHVQERTAFAVAQAGAALQWEAVPNVFATLRADVGDVGPTVGQAITSRMVGTGFAIGSRTLIGPVSASVHGRSMSTLMLDLDIGHLF